MSLWMDAPPTPDDLAAEPEEDKGVRLLRTLRAFNEAPEKTTAIQIDDQMMFVVKLTDVEVVRMAAAPPEGDGLDW